MAFDPTNAPARKRGSSRQGSVPALQERSINRMMHGLSVASLPSLVALADISSRHGSMIVDGAIGWDDRKGIHLAQPIR
jgi:hypothetical protein